MKGPDHIGGSGSGCSGYGGECRRKGVAFGEKDFGEKEEHPAAPPLSPFPLPLLSRFAGPFHQKLHPHVSGFRVES